MGQTREALTPTLAERWCWRAAVRDHARGVRRLDQKQVRDGV